MRKSSRSRIELVEAAGVRAYPQRASAVFVERGYPIIGQGRGVVRIIFVNRETVTIISIHPLLRAEP